MVFESLVADLLNKYLGDYVENLDRSQLKIGIWGGDVVLKHLTLKQSALDELNLPIKTVYGYLGKLVLKIPWKNLYNAPVEAQINNLFILATPNTSIKYDAEKEEKWFQEGKQSELRKIELAKKAELDKDKPLPKPGDNSFTEKLITQIIRNVQISITNIHIRYEDNINRLGSPISIGVTLHSLSVKSINSWGDPTPIDPINLIFKELVLDCLSVYWNPDSNLFSNSDESDYKLYFTQGIATKDAVPTDYKYILGPINSSANLRINSKPESDGTGFIVPQVFLKFEMERLLIRVSKVQFRDILILLDAFSRMSIQSLYRKYRPHLNQYRGHYKEWWHFAYNCIVETEIRRRKRNWDWHHIIQHRNTCREYAQCYKSRISTNKPSSEVTKHCSNLEQQIDVLNIILIRERIEMEVAREGKTQEQNKEAQGGWFSRWWGGGQTKSDSPAGEDDIVQKFQDAMTAEEKQKLFRAIGYQESASPTEYPPYFVVIDMNLVLHRLQIELINQNLQDPHVLSVRFTRVACRVQKRPQSLTVNTYVKLLSVRGSRQGDVIPRLVEPKIMTKEDHDELDSSDSQCVFKCLVELNPLDGMCDQRIHVQASPLRIIYDAVTINYVADVFTSEEKVAMEPIQTAAQNKLAELKQKSTLGLQHVVDNHSVMDLQVNMMASYIIIPNAGFFQENEPAVVLNLGRFELNSKPHLKQEDGSANVRALHTKGHSEEEIFAEMVSKVYDNFQLKLSDLQVLFAMKNEKWEYDNDSMIAEKLYLLKPTTLSINFAVCFICDDPRIPKMKLDACLPLISLHFVEDRIINLVKLFLSIPLPESSTPTPEAPVLEMKGAAALGSTASLTGIGAVPLKFPSAVKMDSASTDEHVVQMIEMQMNFELKEVNISIMKGSLNNPADTEKLLYFKMLSLEASFEKKTFDLCISLRLGGASLVQSYLNYPVNILETPMTSGQQEYLLNIKYVNVDRSSPEFHSKHGSVLQLIDFNFTKVEVLFHQEAMLYLINFSNNISSEISKVKQEIDEARESGRELVVAAQVIGPLPSTPSIVGQPSVTYSRVLSMIKEEGGLISSKPITTKAKSKQLKRVEVIDLKINVCMRSISIGLATHALGPITYLGVTGGVAVVTIKKSYTQIEASLMGISVKDHTLLDNRYSEIVSVVDDKEALVVKVVLFNDNDEMDKSLRKMDISVNASMACVRFIFLNRFISSLTSFLNNFQAAQNVIVEASHAAAEAAKHNVQDVYANAVRIQLDIKIKAPIIVVPVNKSESEAYLLDLGYLSVSNNIIDISIADSDELAAIDNLQLDLQNLKLLRVILDDKLQVISERQVLKPISFKLSVQRNLSSGWYTAIPDLEIGGKLQSINLVLFKEDYVLLMRILKENVGDKVEEPPPPPPPPTKRRPTVTVRAKSKASFMATSMQRSSVANFRKFSIDPNMITQSIVGTKEKVNVSIKFYFTMESLEIELFTGDINNKRTVESLAEFKLLMICVRGSLLSDNSIQLSLLLMDCILDDTRPSQSTNIKRYMEKKVTEQSGDDGSGSTKTMIDVVFQQKADALFIDLRVSSFILILNLEHLLKIASVFTFEEEVTNQTPLVSQPPPTTRASVNVSGAVEKEDASKYAMTVNLKLEHPDIILVETMDDINTSAIMFQAEIIFKLRILEDSTFINGSVTDMQLFTCCYNPSFRDHTKAHVLRPFSILMSGCSPHNVGHNIDISTTNIRISLSADTIQLLNSIIAAATQGNKVTNSNSYQLVDNKDMWQISSFADTDYAFLATELAEEATVDMSEISFEENKKETCIFSIPSLVVTVESGSGLSRTPILLLESSVQATIKDWTTQLNVDSRLRLKLSYYNHSMALWEPLIEPVEEIISGQSHFSPWDLNIQVEASKPNNQSDGKDKADMSIFISSKEMMSITITKTCLEVLNTLSASFTDAIYKPVEKITVLDQAQFILINNTGLSINVHLKDSDFMLYRHTRTGLNDTDEIREVELDSNAQVELSPIDKDFIPLESSTGKERFINIKIKDYECEMDVPVMRADKRFFLLNQRSASNDPWGIVSDVTVANGCTTVTLRSIIQVKNHFKLPVRVYYMTSKGNEVKLVGSIEPQGTLNLPLKAIYTPTSELFFSVQGYTVSIIPFFWKDLQRTLEQTLLMQCNPKNIEDKEPFYIKAVGEIEQVYFELTNRHTMASNCYNIHIRPAVVLRNILPLDIVVCAQGVPSEREVKAGDSVQLPTIEPGSSSIVIRIPEYLDREWSCKHEITATPTEFSVWTFEAFDSPNKFTLDLGIHSVNKNGSNILSLYCPFWMINNTGLLLSYRQSDDTNNVIYHPSDLKGPVMFSFHSKTFFAKKKSCVRVADGSWSDKFSLDVAGSSGVVVSKTKDMQYQIGVHIRLTYSTLTKQIRFTPYFIIVNNFELSVELKESSNDNSKWIQVDHQSCSPLWPKNVTSKDDGHLILRIKDTTETTIPFSFNKTHTSVLKLDNKYGAVYVDVQITEGITYITVYAYEDGMAPALILNHTHSTINFRDKSKEESVFVLRPMEKKLFSWETSDPNRLILFADGKGSHTLREDGIGEVSLGGEEGNKAYWVSFLYGLQRVLLLTPDSVIAQQAHTISDVDTISQEIELSIHGIGVSLVNNLSRVEVLYLGITSSGVIWEGKKANKNRFKALSSTDSGKIEAAYSRYIAQKDAYENPSPSVFVDQRIMVNFETSEMTAPVQKVIRRRYKTGLWVQIKSSPMQLQFHAKINRIQIDNQMNDCIFPVIFFPVPPPKSINNENAGKPFVELSIVKRLNNYSAVQQYKYFKLLIQEFHVKVDICFINALVKLFEEGEQSEKDKITNFMKDLKLTTDPLMSQIVSTFQDQKNVYDILHLSPLKIHVSFSLSGGGNQGSESGSTTPEFISVFAQSFGVTLTDIQDCVFKLAYFERQCALMTQGQLIAEVQQHYFSQLLKQLYVLVLGLDVIGNPFGLVMGFTQGATDLFYEPFQGAIQGPGEFAEGLVLGVRSLFGHTVGGAAGAFSKITGAMGKGLAALTFDKEYQRQRREAMSNKPQNVQEGLAQSGKGLVMGVVEGVGGVITKPISGAKEEGVHGFFKGVGKGIMGLVTRPTAGVIDFASGSFSAVKRVADSTEETRRMRVSRHFDADGLVKPYSSLLAEGNKLLMDLEKGKYLATDVYEFHMPIGHGKQKDMLLLTDQRIAYLSHNEIFGGYQMEWFHVWHEMSDDPKVVPQGVALSIADKKKGVKNIFSGPSTGKVLLIQDEQIKKLLVEKIIYFMTKTNLPKRSNISKA